MSDKKYVYKCPGCGAIEERNDRGAVCKDCHIFLHRVIESNAFEKAEVEHGE